MATGVARQNFSPISNINYDTLAQFKQAGLERVYQSDAAKQDRFRQGLKEAEQNRMLQAQTTGAIGGLLRSNPDLLNEAPETVQKAYKSYERGGGSLESNALLANYLTTSDAQQKQAQLLQFEQEQQALRQQTALRNAQANFLKQQAALQKPQDRFVTPEEYQKILADNPNMNFSATPVVVNGEPLLKLGASRLPSATETPSQPMTVEEAAEFEKQTGTIYAKTPVRLPDGSLGVRLGKSYAPEGEGVSQFTKFEEKTAEEFQSDARYWISDKSTPRLKAQNNLAIFEEALTQLESGEVILGTTGEKITSLLAGIGMDDPIRQFFNPDSQNVLDNIRGVIFLGLRETLGAQFTENEGARLVRASYNPALTNEQNVQRLKRMADLLRTTIAYKDELSSKALSEDGIVDLVKGGVQSMKSFFDSELRIMEDEYNQAALLAGEETIPVGGQKPKPPIQYPASIQDIINKYSK